MLSKEQYTLDLCFIYECLHSILLKCRWVLHWVKTCGGICQMQTWGGITYSKNYDIREIHNFSFWNNLWTITRNAISNGSKQVLLGGYTRGAHRGMENRAGSDAAIPCNLRLHNAPKACNNKRDLSEPNCERSNLQRNCSGCPWLHQKPRFVYHRRTT